jgi:wyosine [tRNA(Phe)-imidazoG37] synthetase (radical SAM superfamily)
MICHNYRRAPAIALAKEVLGLPVAVLTNSGLLPLADVRADLGKADIVVCKLDAYDDESFKTINRPLLPYTFGAVYEGLREFRRGFAGKLVLQVTLVEANLASAGTLAALARELAPDEVELNLRIPWWIARAPGEHAERIHRAFAGLQANCLHTDGPSWAQVSDSGSLEASRPNAAVMLMALAA